VQKRILGHLVGYYAVEVGELNKVVHLWAYESMDERAKRGRAVGDPEWLAYAARSGRWWSTRPNQILTPAPFFKVPDPV
jgi:hypothetical protein